MTRNTLVAFAILVVVLTGAVSVQAQVTCVANAGVPLIVRVQGTAEPVGDYTLTCTGGISTPPGLPVPQMNLTVFLNTNLTSKKTAAGFSEALLLVDEPNTTLSPGVPTLNCGDNGAPDNGVSGPGICEIISTGIPTTTYNGTMNGFGTAVCDGLSGRPAANSYTCGRPNIFQGRFPSPPTSNVVEFLGVPFEPPGAGTRTFRITNVRADGSALGPSTPVAVIMTIAISGTVTVVVSSPTQTVGFTQQGLVFTVPSPTPGTSIVRVTEGFADSFRTKNLSDTVGNGGMGNATFGGSGYTYNGNTHYPADLAQNVPGIFYNSESGLEWRNNGVNGPPSPNPPLGYAGFSVPNLGNPFFSASLGGLNTKISSAGVANQGTRIALDFTGVPPGHHVIVPEVVHLHRVGTPGVNTGVLVLTKTNAAGKGVFNRTNAGSSIPAGDFAVYEVLYADPFSVEYADIPCTLVGGGSGAGIKVNVSFAPFYPGAPPANPPIPRFRPAAGAPLTLF
jgi:hypothetical protein